METASRPRSAAKWRDLGFLPAPKFVSIGALPRDPGNAGAPSLASAKYVDRFSSLSVGRGSSRLRAGSAVFPPANRPVQVKNSCFRLRLSLFLLLLCLPPAQAQLSFDTVSVAPQRFVAAHGQKAVIMGYASSGLEIWAYPVQLISGYEIGFRSAGQTTEVAGTELLRRITYHPEAITRTYIGPGFIVRERLFVPLHEPAAFVTYTVDSRQPVDIVVHFTPVLNLMWPFSLGAQNVHWDQPASAYVLGEGSRKYGAIVASPAVLSHDEIFNSAQPGTLRQQIAFTIRAGGANSSATVVVAQNNPGSDAASRVRELLSNEKRFEAEARDHYADLLANTLRIDTPDPAVNQQLAWAQIALDQAWVCNQVWGCGLIAGYGPSRPGRRPQYDWFFAGDGLIATDALVNSGDYARAREELAFIAKYQQPHTGMIWHEISQSADPADWATKYPYMFVHVDITAHYLTVVEHYVAASGDVQFLQQNWAGLEAAYRYCKSLLNADDGLPRIPSNKEGGNEQDRLTDDAGLAMGWLKASSAFARLAALHGDHALSQEATQFSERAKASIAHRYWDDQRNTWIDGYNRSGPVFRESGIGVHLAGIVDQRRSETILDRIASSDFQTDWGTRGVAASSPRYEPDSYASGSVSAASSAGVAGAYWSEHRPVTAYAIWSALLPWGTLDSMGHMHEVLTGDFYHQQIESVPEQTWSSAAFLSSAIQGLLGLERDAQGNQLAFSPHMPADWDRLSIAHLTVGGGALSMVLSRTSEGLDLEIENSGGPVALVFSPEIPLGAEHLRAQWNGKAMNARIEPNPQDAHAIVTVTVPNGKSHCVLRYQGGVSVDVRPSSPLVGDASQGIKIVSAVYTAKRLSILADVSPNAAASTIELRTTDKPAEVQGAKLTLVSPPMYQLAVNPPDTGSSALPDGYRRAQITVSLAAGK